jgi:nucleoside-diphosphate-sugar epimerase
MKLYQGYHDFIFIDDFVRGINTLVTTDNNLYGDIVNFGSGTQYSNFEVLNMFEKITGKFAPVEKVEQISKSFENNIWVCDTTYALTEYKFKVEYDLYFGINRFLETDTYG